MGGDEMIDAMEWFLIFFTRTTPMSEAMEWFLIFFMFYVFLSVYMFMNTLEKILNMIGEISKQLEQSDKRKD